MVHSYSSAVKVVHALPHRTRLRVPTQHRTPEGMARLKKAMEGTAGVRSVEINPKTGSVLLNHDTQPGILEKVGVALEETPGLMHLLMPEADELEAEISGLSKIADAVEQALFKADSKFSRATENVIDLKMLIPVLLAFAGFTQLKEKNGFFAGMPPFVLFYYAFDAYMKFHGTSRQTESTVPIKQISQKT